MAWLQLLLSALIVLIAGTKLSQYGDRIAEGTGLGGLWIGVILMAGATSLPEVLTVISAGLVEAPDLAAGDLLGAGLSNMLALAVIDLSHRQKQVWQHAALDHALIASLAMALTALAGLGTLFHTDWAYAGVGLETTLIAVAYVLGIRIVFRQEALRHQEKARERVIQMLDAVPASDNPRWFLRAGLGFGASSLGILLAAPILVISAQQIAEETGISTTFIGTFLVAITTSLPELVTAFAAVRLGAFDLAVGNLFGSNAFNMCALFFADVAYRQGPLLNAVSPTHAITALVGVILMSVGLMGIIYRAEKRFLLVEPDSLLMVIGYAVGIWILFRVGR